MKVGKERGATDAADHPRPHEFVRVRMMYSRAGDDLPDQAIIYAEAFSPNMPEGACSTGTAASTRSPSRR